MAAVVVQVFGDVGQLREITEGAHHQQRLARESAHPASVPVAPVAVILRLAETHRSAAHILDQLKGFFAFLFAQGVAENTAEQAYIVAQRHVLAGDVGWGGNQIHFFNCRRRRKSTAHLLECAALLID